jgi:hypothetical protein
MCSILLCFVLHVVVVTTFPSRILGFVQLYTFLFTRLDQLPLMENLTRYDQLLIVLPAGLTLVLFLFNISFLIIIFKF